MKKIYYFIFILFLAPAAFAKTGNTSLQQMLMRSDIAVEGVVLEQQEVKIENRGFNLNKLYKFKIDKVYLGKIKEGQIIDIYGGSDFICDISNWEKDKQYILFLKKLKKIKNGYIDTRNGRGTYSIQQKDGKRMVYSGVLAREEWYEYDQFIKDLNELKK